MSKGRQKGATNVLGRLAKDNVAAVFNRIGGTHAMAQWARDNPDKFYTIYAKLIPLEHTGVDGSPLTLQVVNYTDSLQVSTETLPTADSEGSGLRH